MKKIIVVFLVLDILILAGVYVSTTRKNSVFEEGKTTIITSAMLMDAIDISELSSAQYTYNGIAEMYKDEKKEKIKCYIKYNAKVKAGIDMKKVDFVYDHKNKTITPILPEIQITSNTVDEKCISFIPDNAKVEIKDALVACEEDAICESEKSAELINSARENFKSIIEGLLDPVLKPTGYRIIWE